MVMDCNITILFILPKLRHLPLSIGSLRKGVFEQCMSIGSETSFLFIHLRASKFVLLSLLLYRNHLLENLGQTTAQECQNYTSAHMHCSKTPLLKLPNNDYTKSAIGIKLNKIVLHVFKNSYQNILSYEI